MITIGLVGLGFIGTTHLQAYAQIDNCRVKTICSRSNANAAKLAEQFNTSYVTEYDDILADPAIDVIDICVPTHLHELLITQAANAGKHIICEKPLTLTTDGAKRVINAVQVNNVRLFVGHVLRFWPEYALIKSYSDDHHLKNIETVHAERLGQKPAWSEWFQHPEKSGGALFDLHIHDIDFIYTLLGEMAQVHSVGHINQHGAWDHVLTTLMFKNGSNAFVEASHRMPETFPFTMSLRAHGTSGTLDFRMAAGENIENYDNSHKQLTYMTNVNMKPLDVDQTDPFVEELSYFVDCLDYDKDNTVVPLSDVLYVLNVMEAIETSLKTDSPVDVQSTEDIDENVI